MEIPVQLTRKLMIDGNTSKREEVYSIGKGGLYNIKVRALPIRIQCLEGLLWVTREKDPEDHLLRCSHSVEFLAGGRIVIQGLTGGRFRILSQ